MSKHPLATCRFLAKALFQQIRNIINDSKQLKLITDFEKSIAWENIASRIPSNNQPLYKRHHNLPKPLIVSLTSYSLRFPILPLTLKCLLSQTLKPDKVILWIANEQKEYLNDDILTLQDHGLHIYYCPDLGPFTKIIPTLKNYSDHFIVTADDDLYYWPTWLEELVSAWNGSIHDVVAHRVHKILLDGNNLPLEYSKWSLDDHNTQNASYLNFATGVGGVLYPPGTFHSDVLKADIFTKLCLNADDIWLYWMERLNKSYVRRTYSKKAMLEWPNSQQVSKKIENVNKNNDQYIKYMIEAYGFPI